ncbi:MAG: phosphatase PAP2 family protein, partial [Clostridia bacterium]|nr:phosphatase PAP2 family protein [Clostridia bacterium]
VMPTAVMQFNERIKNAKQKQCVNIAVIVFSVFMVTGRLLSGVHWFSDIIGGALLSGGLVTLYRSFKNKVARN